MPPKSHKPKRAPKTVGARPTVVVRLPKRPRASQNVTIRTNNIRKRRGPAIAKLNSRGQGYRSRNVSDGINLSTQITNNSMLEDRFATRMEKVCNITGTAGFSIFKSLYINPGNSVLFPIFSQIAKPYEQFRVNTLKFHYRTREYTASGSNVGAGLVLMATNFDPDDPPFATDTEMQNYWHATSAAPYERLMNHNVLEGHRKSSARTGPRDATLNNYYVYPSNNVAAPITGSTKFYDIGLFQAATSGNVISDDIIGELWVEHSFTMIHPKQYVGPGTAPYYAHVATGGDDCSAANVFGPGTVGFSNTNFPVAPSASGSTLLIPDCPVGQYSINTSWYDAVISAGAEQSTITGASGLNLWTIEANAESGAFSASSPFAGAAIAVDIYYFVVTTPGAVLITWSGLTGMVTGNFEMIISQLNNSLSSAIHKPLPIATDDRVAALESLVRKLMAPHQTDNNNKISAPYNSDDTDYDQVACASLDQRSKLSDSTIITNFRAAFKGF